MRTRAAILDSVIVAVAAGTVQWVFFVEPYLHTSLQPFTRLVDVTYPTMDLLDARRARSARTRDGQTTCAYQLLS